MSVLIINNESIWNIRDTSVDRVYKMKNASETYYGI